MASAASRGEDRRHGEPPGLRRVGGQHRERAPGGGEAEVGVDDPAEQLGVVGDDKEHGPTTMNGSSAQPTLATPTTPSATAPARPTTVTATRAGAGIRVCSGRPFSSSSAWAARPTARKKAISVASSGGQADLRGQRGADDDVGEVPGRVRRMQQGPPVAPSARARGVVRGPCAAGSASAVADRRRLRRGLAASPSATCARSPHDQPAAQAHDPDADVGEPGLAPCLDRPRHRVAAVVPGDARARGTGRPRTTRGRR